MYLPAHFEERRPELLHALLREYPLGLLVTQALPAGAAAPQIETNAIPFMLDAERGPHGTLVAHVARANPLWREARTDCESVVVFQGAQTYITPSWYATKAEHGNVVPTWNYVIAEARGQLRVHDDAAWLHALVSRLTDTHEAQSDAPWQVGDAPADYIDTMLRAIVGIEIELTALVGKWKVSQNRPVADRAGVARGLPVRQGSDEQRVQAQVMAALVQRD